VVAFTIILPSLYPNVCKSFRMQLKYSTVLLFLLPHCYMYFFQRYILKVFLFGFPAFLQHQAFWPPAAVQPGGPDGHEASNAADAAGHTSNHASLAGPLHSYNQVHLTEALI
jgi:hypothetical protein